MKQRPEFNWLVMRPLLAALAVAALNAVGQALGTVHVAGVFGTLALSLGAAAVSDLVSYLTAYETPEAKAAASPYEQAIQSYVEAATERAVNAGLAAIKSLDAPPAHGDPPPGVPVTEGVKP